MYTPEPAAGAPPTPVMNATPLVEAMARDVDCSAAAEGEGVWEGVGVTEGVAPALSDGEGVGEDEGGAQYAVSTVEASIMRTAPLAADISAAWGLAKEAAAYATPDCENAAPVPSQVATGRTPLSPTKRSR